MLHTQEQDKQYIIKWQHKTKNIGDIKIIYITHNLVDIFFNTGWQQHTRIKLDRKAKSFAFTNHEQRKDARLGKLVLSILGEL